MVSKLVVLTIHLAVALFCAYLAWAILTKRPIPKLIGLFLAALAVALVAMHIYFYDQKSRVTSYLKQRGIHFDPKDPEYGPIGGRPGGVTWV